MRQVKLRSFVRVDAQFQFAMAMSTLMPPPELPQGPRIGFDAAVA